MSMFDSFFDTLIAAVFFLTPVLLVAVVLYFSHRRERERNRLIEKMIEQGESPETILPLLTKTKQEKTPTHYFKWGIVILCIGLGGMAYALIMETGNLGWGAFFAILGLGELAISWYLRHYSK